MLRENGLEITFDLLRATVKTLDGDASITSKRQVRLKCSASSLQHSCKELTCPRFPRPTFTRTSTRSATTLRLARASMPKIMTAPRLWALGRGRSEPSTRGQLHILSQIRKRTVDLPQLRDDIAVYLVILHHNTQHLLQTRQLGKSGIVRESIRCEQVGYDNAK